MANGFYGNISNVSKTQMQIDKIYSSRKKMEENANSDGIALGRYVLVEYGSKIYKNYFHLGFDGKSLYLSAPSDNLRVTSEVENGEIIKILGPIKTEDGKNIFHNWTDRDPLNQKTALYRCSFENGYAIATKIQSSEGTAEENFYMDNYQIDREYYKGSRGYDSTVWIKTLRDGGTQYVKVADLNTIPPTFGTTTDAPTEEIKSPYFGKDSSDVLYNLHVQPNWGFRVKAASEGEPSDEKTQHILYDVEEMKWEPTEKAAAIYYNKDGFKKDTETYIENKEDSIQITSSGESGYVYSNNEIAKDTKELSIYLPSLGNTISEIWNIIYGAGIKENENKRKINITYEGKADWFSDTNETTYNLNTIAGCLNSAQKIIGLIVDKPNSEITQAEYEKNLIYKDSDGKYYTIYYNSVSEVYSYIEVPISEGISNLFGLISQINRILGPEDNSDPKTLRGALNTVENRMEEWKDELADAATKAFGIIADADGTAIATAIIDENSPTKLPDTLRIGVDDYISVSGIQSDDYRGINLSLKVDNTLTLSDGEESKTGLASSLAVIEQLGNISTILDFILKGQEEPVVDYSQININVNENLIEY